MRIKDKCQHKSGFHSKILNGFQKQRCFSQNGSLGKTVHTFASKSQLGSDALLSLLRCQMEVCQQKIIQRKHRFCKCPSWHVKQSPMDLLWFWRWEERAGVGEQDQFPWQWDQGDPLQRHQKWHPMLLPLPRDLGPVPRIPTGAVLTPETSPWSSRINWTLANLKKGLLTAIVSSVTRACTDWCLLLKP